MKCPHCGGEVLADTPITVKIGELELPVRIDFTLQKGEQYLVTSIMSEEELTPGDLAMLNRLAKEHGLD